MKQFLKISNEVAEALAANKPVVALESTIISHGMPYPQNVETALTVEKIIRERGAIPATIAIINGMLTVGCSEQEIDYLGRKGLEVTKVSRRDIPFIVAKKTDGRRNNRCCNHVHCLSCRNQGFCNGRHRWCSPWR